MRAEGAYGISYTVGIEGVAGGLLGTSRIAITQVAGPGDCAGNVRAGGGPTLINVPAAIPVGDPTITHDTAIWCLRITAEAATYANDAWASATGADSVTHWGKAGPWSVGVLALPEASPDARLVITPTLLEPPPG
jgi:hypothetical protein